MSSYHEICPKCEDETITHGWSPSSCPFCKINQLERELAEAQTTLQFAKKEYHALFREFSILVNMRDILVEALRKIAGDRGESSAVSLSEAQQIADEALAAMKGGEA